MLMPNAMTNSITFFLHWVKEASPTVWPAVIMTDHDQAQINVIRQVYPQSQTFLYTWHVLCAMQSHFAMNEFQALWDKIKAWVKTNDLAEFYTLWDEISSDPSVPQSVVKYLATEWLPVSHLWSKAAWKNISIFEEGDTNMLIELYVPVIYTMHDKITEMA
jgi:MULE transposase domain